MATAFSSQIGMRLCSLSIGSHNLFPRLHEVLYTHFKNVQNFTIHSRLSVQLSADAYAYSLPERASQLAAYAPVDKKAYRTLQGRTGRYGYIEPHDLEDWASSERLAISEAAGFMKAKDAFVGKAV